MITNLFFFTSMKRRNGKIHIFIYDDYNKSVCGKHNMTSTSRSMHPISVIKHVLGCSNICKVCKRIIEKELNQGENDDS